MKTKFYKKVLKAFGGAAIYLDKELLKALGVTTGDEVTLSINDSTVIISKSSINSDKIQELLNELNYKLEKRI